MGKISHRIYIDKTTSKWQAHIHDINVSDNEKLKHLPDTLDSFSVNSLIITLANLNICEGNTGYEELCRAKDSARPSVFPSKDGQSITAYEEVGFSSHSTIRHSKCALLLKYSTICDICSVYKGDLKSLTNKLTDTDDIQTVEPFHSHTKLSCLNEKQKRQKIQILKQEKRNFKRRVETLETRFQDILANYGEELPDKYSNSFKQILHDSDEFKGFPDGSPENLLWKQQLKYLTSKNKHGMRWHPTIIKWCIAVYSKSTRAYDMIRQSGFLHLPHSSTLRDYTHFTTAKSGFNIELLNRIKDDIQFDSLKPFKRNVILLFDEVKVKEGLVNSTETGELIGFTDLGDVNNEILQLVNTCKDDTSQDKAGLQVPRLATHIIAFMVRGIFLRLHQVFAHFPCTGFNSHQLYHSVWQAVGVLESAKFNVRAKVCDGATPNRKFFKIHKERQVQPVNGQRQLTYYSLNPFRRGYKIYFICDPPHLLKTTRNNWENSGWHSKTRNLEFDGQQILWTQLVNLTETDLLGNNGQAGGLRMLPKLSNEHLRLTPSLRMKVKLATQVLSASVARAFELVDRLRPTTQSTRKFIIYMDTFFDCMNVSRPHLEKRKRKPTLATKCIWLVK